MPCSEKRARLLLQRRKARIHSMQPFIIRLVNRTIQESVLQPLRCKIDPGSKTTGIAIIREYGEQQIVVSLIELNHRGSTIHETLQKRAANRKLRRSALRYRPPRFSNRKKPTGWLAPSLRHRVESVMTWVQRLRKRLPLTATTCERVRFDTQKLLNSEVSGIEYQQGTLFGYEIREYLLEKWGRQCVYCKAQNIPLQVDHIIPRSKGGSDRASNLTLACASCNLKKGNLSIEEFSPELVKSILSKPPLAAAAAVNSTRIALWNQLTALPLSCEASTGGETKYNRKRLNIPKTHALDAACTGKFTQLQNWQILTQQIACTGRGSYQRTRLDRFGSPRGFLMRQKKVHGFQTGDHVISSVPSGKKKGTYKGRVAVRASGSFNIQTADGVIQGISSRYCRLLQRADGYRYLTFLSVPKSENDILNQKLEERRFHPVLKDRVSAPLIG